MDAALAIGRIVLVIIFIFSGFGKFADLSGTAAYIASKGLPFPQLLAAGAGAGEADLRTGNRDWMADAARRRSA